MRFGVHTGEVEDLSDRLAGIAVHIDARVGTQAGPDEVPVTSAGRAG